MKACQIQSQGLIVLLCLVNLLNYIDRGIIPGAPQSFRRFITSSLGVAVTDQSVYLGLLSSSFIIGHSILSIVFGYFASTHRPFRIISLGTSIWIVAIIICAISEHVNSYALLIVGRVLSGVGEASFQCVAPPFIDRHAPPARRSFYVGIYLASVIVGTAIGFVYGSLFAESSLTWAGAFYFEAILMACLIFCCLFCVPDELNVVPPTDDEAALRKPLVSTNEFASEVMSLSRESRDTVDKNAAELSPTEYADKLGVLIERPHKENSESFLQTWWEILSDVPFLLVVLAHGAYTFTLGVFNAFGPDVFIGLGLFSDETSALCA
ncbi:Major Facilitator Superfamily [Phytophthora infestans]|uniref:Major Facilitator Superfamily n=1 Tax=Phytophthora infestans TaxID=4787 RepID=A0A833WF63_PHYIN|nr:Major Facilitator Superfamily [Phytophthora infestans]KAF4136858.1 Major Facilitator Superfamily [Phytophthora infestans]